MNDQEKPYSTGKNDLFSEDSTQRFQAKITLFFVVVIKILKYWGVGAIVLGILGILLTLLFKFPYESYLIFVPLVIGFVLVFAYEDGKF